MHALRLVLTYDLLEDRRIDDVIITRGDASGFNCKYFLEILGYYPSIPNILSCARVSKSARMLEMSLDLKYAR